MKHEIVLDTKGREVTPLQSYSYRDEQGDTKFGRLGYTILRVIVRNTASGYTLVLKANCKTKDSVVYTITHPSKWEHPRLTVGSGRSRQSIPDVLADKVEVKGEVEKYDYQQDFAKRLTSAFGQEMTTKILRLLADAMED